eukprot:TRINITY_DN1604_c1_g3_i1.p1 TRINITY_DN1604_c1_g3~~TRINITY_DN1604_c1_g3_i1.p1  ORF type:complete len:955 (-),score=337.75 TRINITY_DN1604_c1_g3_i1:456-3320(-)
MADGNSLSLGDRKAVQQVLESRKDRAVYCDWLDKYGKKKQETRLFVIGQTRIYSLKAGGKVAREGHLLDLVELLSLKPDQVNLSFKSFKLNVATPKADHIIHLVRLAYHNAFPDMPERLRFKCDVVPPSRLQELPPVTTPLGGYVATYTALCDYLQAEVREDIIWDMENLFVPGGLSEFNFREFEQPISEKDIKTLVGALAYNTYFRSLIAKNMPLDKNMLQAVADTLRSNTKLEELVLDRVGITKEGIATISEAMIANKALALTTINLANNTLEDKGLTSFSMYIAGLPRGLVKLDLSGCSAGKSGMVAICSALKKNAHMAGSLSHLDLSHNKLEADGSAALASFLASPNQLRTLVISNTNAHLEVITGAMLRGSPELAHLDVSGNPFGKKEAPYFVKFLQSATSCAHLDLTNTAAPPECYNSILQAVLGNVYLKDVHINLAQNKLGMNGARLIAAMATQLTNVVSLDLTDNELNDDGVIILCEGLAYNTKLKHLNLSHNFKTRGKNRPQAVEAIVKLVSTDQSPLESLELEGGSKSELKNDILPLILALATNDSLKSLNISGHQFGNKGASALGKALQTNQKLTSLRWDNNLTTAPGFQIFYLGLKRSRTLKEMPLPLMDISAAFAASKGPEIQALNDVIRKIERCIMRNQNPDTFRAKAAAAASTTFGFLTSGVREEMQKVLHKINATGQKPEGEDRTVLEDAEAQDQVVTQLFNIKDQYQQALEEQLRAALGDFVQQIHPLYAGTRSQLIDSVRDHVRTSYRSLDDDTIKRLQPALAYGGKDLHLDDFEKLLVQEVGGQILSKANQAFHSTTTIASDYLYEKLQDRLEEIHFDLMQSSAPPPTSRREHSAGSYPSVAPKSPAASRSKPAADSPAPKKPPPPVPTKELKKKSEPTKKPERPPRTDLAPEVRLEQLPKVTSNLRHATRARAAGDQQRRAPTRKPRPAAPAHS